LILEGQKAIEVKNYNDALYLFGEAHSMTKWQGLFGSRILSSLAYANALKGNLTLAKQYQQQYEQEYG
jgi:outer membrane protein assembly factor BamD (BamD/ComL family)